jgi:hypothetical protein
MHPMQQMQMHPHHMPPHMGYQYQPQGYPPQVYQPPQAPRQVRGLSFGFRTALHAQRYTDTNLSQPTTSPEQHFGSFMTGREWGVVSLCLQILLID